MKKTFILVAALFLLGGLYAVSYMSKSKKAPIKVGVLLPLSGDVAVFGEKAMKGFLLAESLYSQDRVQFIYEDTAGYDAAGAVRAANKLLAIDKVNLLLGPYGPEQALAIAPLAEARGMPVFAFSLCSQSFTAYKNLFCGYSPSEQQLQTALPFIQKSGIKTLALVLEQSDYGIETGAIMNKKANETGYTVVLESMIQGKDKDFRTLAARIRKENPNGVFIAVIDPRQAFNFFKQLYEMGYRGIRVAYIDVDPKYLKEYGVIAEGIYAPGVLPNNYSDQFTKSFKEKYHEDPDLYSAVAYDLTRLTIEAIKKNGWSTKNLAEKVIGNTVSGSAVPGVKFLQDRTVSFPLELQVSNNGRYVKAEY